MHSKDLKTQLTHCEDLHRYRCAQALPVSHVYLFNWHQDGQTNQGDEQLSCVGFRQVLHD